MKNLKSKITVILSPVVFIIINSLIFIAFIDLPDGYTKMIYPDRDYFMFWTIYIPFVLIIGFTILFERLRMWIQEHKTYIMFYAIVHLIIATCFLGWNIFWSIVDAGDNKTTLYFVFSTFMLLYYCYHFIQLLRKNRAVASK